MTPLPPLLSPQERLEVPAPKVSRVGPSAQDIPEEKLFWLVKGGGGRLELRLFIPHPAHVCCAIQGQLEGGRMTCIPQWNVVLRIPGVTQHPKDPPALTPSWHSPSTAFQTATCL